MDGAGWVSRFAQASVPETASRPSGGPIGLLLSLSLHGAALAGLIGWGGLPAGPVEETPVLMVDLVEVAAPPSEPADAEPKQQEVATPPPTAKTPSLPPAPHPQPVKSARTAAVSALRPAALPPSNAGQEPLPVIAPEMAALPPAGSETGLPGGRADATGREKASSNLGAADAAPAAKEPDGAPAALPGNPAPVYPLPARRAGREGRTVLRVLVDASGNCSEAHILASSGTPSLDEAALAAVRRWRFHPARLDGQAVEKSLDVPVAFSLTASAD